MVLPGGGPMEAMGVQKLYDSVRTLTYAHSVCGPRRQCAGARALDAPVPQELPPRPLYSDHPTPAPPAPERQVSTWACRCTRRVGQEGKQRVRDQPMVVAVWAGQTSCDGGGAAPQSLVTETEERCMAVVICTGKGWCEEGRGDQGPKAPQGFQGGRGPGRTGIGYP